MKFLPFDGTRKEEYCYIESSIGLLVACRKITTWESGIEVFVRYEPIPKEEIPRIKLDD